MTGRERSSPSKKGCRMGEKGTTGMTEGKEDGCIRGMADERDIHDKNERQRKSQRERIRKRENLPFLHTHTAFPSCLSFYPFARVSLFFVFVWRHHTTSFLHFPVADINRWKDGGGKEEEECLSLSFSPTPKGGLQQHIVAGEGRRRRRIKEMALDTLSNRLRKRGGSDEGKKVRKDERGRTVHP